MTASTPLALLSLGGAAAVIALSGAMAPGPYLTVTIARTIRSGRRSAFMMLLGHALLEAVLLVGFAFGLQSFLSRPDVSRVLALAGGLFLLWTGTGLLRGAVSGSIAGDLEASEATSTLGPVAEGAAVSFANPYWLLWWVTIGAALAAQALAIGPVGVLAFYLGHQAGDLAWYAFVIVAVSRGHHLLPPRTYRLIMGVLALLLLALGVRFALVGFGVLTLR